VTQHDRWPIGVGQQGQLHIPLPRPVSLAFDDLCGDNAEVDGQAGVVAVTELGREQQVLDDLAEVPGTGDELVDVVADILDAGAGTKVHLKQLSPGVQLGQRSTQLVAGVGDELPLPGKRIRQRGRCAAGEQRRRQHRDEQTDQFTGDKGTEQPLPLVVLLVAAHDDLHRLGSPLPCQGQVATFTAVDLGRLGRPADPDTLKRTPVGKLSGCAIGGLDLAPGVLHEIPTSGGGSSTSSALAAVYRSRLAAAAF